MPLGGPLAVVAALRANDPLDLPPHRLVQHRQTGAEGQREQSLLRLPSDLCQRQLDVLRQRQRRSLLSLDDLRAGRDRLESVGDATSSVARRKLSLADAVRDLTVRR